MPQRHNTESVVEVYLEKGIVDVFKSVTGPGTRDKIKYKAQERHDSNTKDALPTHGLEGGNIVLTEELLLHTHLESHNDLAR